MSGSERVREPDGGRLTVPLSVTQPVGTRHVGAPTPEPPRLERLPRDRVLGGVAAGLAAHLGLPVRWVRIAFAVLTVTGGSGLALYAAFWVVLPLRPESPDDPAARSTLRSKGEAALLLAAVVVAGVVLGLSDTTLGGVLLPLALVAAGAALVWREADEAQRARWRSSAGGPRPRRRLVSSLAGAALLAAGLAGFLAWRGDLAEAREGLLATAVVVFGLLLLAAPFLSRVLADLRAERTERIRSQERAEIAARLHDSVLQTLALIQKSADDPREVARLARSQERELRSWLYRPAATSTSTLAASIEQTMAEVEEAHGIPVEVVVVGDRPLDEPLRALVAAAREAAWNAAKHSGAPRVQVYAEVESSAVTVFVKDRGCGFDPSAVPDDRYGVRQSICARMERAGGRAVVRTAPGNGTEVRLEVTHG